MSIKCENQNVFFVSGMFAGAWLWDEIHPKLEHSNINIVNKPLCHLSDSIEILSNNIVGELKLMKGKATLVSNSLGSLISLMVAAKAPETVQSVVISGSAGFGTVDLNIKIDRNAPNTMAKKIVERVCRYPERVSDEGSYDVAVCFRDKMKNILRLTRESNKAPAESLLSKIECPVVAVWGDHDRITPLPKATLDRYGIETHVIKNCGHSPMLDQPDKFASILNCILATQ